MLLFSTKHVELGEGPVHVYTLFEIKWLGGILLHKFETEEQDRFHDHAFNAVAFTLSGSYEEEILTPKGIVKRTVRHLFQPRWIPRDYCHRILKAQPNTWTILFFGPWRSYWHEYFHKTNTWFTYTWGRKVTNIRIG